jgi:hypothetical protein
VSLWLSVNAGFAQDVRSRTRPKPQASTSVDESQAVDLTLTLTKASVRPVQTWIRTAGKIDKSLKTITGYVYPPDSGLIQVGQRIRAFPPESKSSMYQARVTRAVPQGGRLLVEATLASSGREQTTNYILEIVVDRGEFLSVPNEAIIEEGDKRVVYLQHHPACMSRKRSIRVFRANCTRKCFTASPTAIKSSPSAASLSIPSTN